MKLADLFIKLGLNKTDYEKGLTDAKKQTETFAGGADKATTKAKSGFNGLQFQVQQLARELPSLSFGIGIFFAAISNNLPMLTDEIKKAKEENLKLAASGQKGIPVWKQMAGSIFSWQTALIIGLTALTVYGREIGTFINGLMKSTKAIDNAKLTQQNYNKTTNEGISNGQKELLTLKLLYSAATDTTKSQKERNDAVNEMQRMYPDYLGKIDDEAIKTGQAGKQYEILKNRIIEAAKARAYSDQIAENSKKIITELEPKLIELQDKHTKALDANKKATEDFNKAVNMGVTELIPYITNMNLTEGSVKKVGREIDSTINSITQLAEENKKLESGISVEGLTFNNKSTKDEIEYLKGSIGYYEKELAKLREKQKLITDPQKLEQSKTEIALKQTLLDQLTGELKLLEQIKLKNKDIAEMFARGISTPQQKTRGEQKNGLIITPQMQTMIDESKARGDAQEAARIIGKSFVDSLNKTISDGITDTIISLSENIGKLISGADVSMNSGKEFGLAVLQTIGKFMQTLGALMISYGVYMGLFAEGVKNPMTWGIALAAGVGMVAAGAAISAVASKGLSKSTAQATATASGYKNFNSSTAASTLNGNVVFELQGTMLRGVLNNTDRKNNLIR